MRSGHGVVTFRRGHTYDGEWRLLGPNSIQQSKCLWAIKCRMLLELWWLQLVRFLFYGRGLGIRLAHFAAGGSSNSVIWMSKNVRNNSLQLKQRTNPADPRRHSYGTTVFNQERHSESLVLGLGFRRDSPFDPDYEDVETEQLFIMYPRIGEHDYSYW